MDYATERPSRIGQARGWLTLLAPGIVEPILMGNEPSGLSLTMLMKMMPMV